jgi:hypothetical protein
VERGTCVGITNFGKNEREIFLRQRLDSPNHVEILREIAFLAHPILRDYRASASTPWSKSNDLRQLGQITWWRRYNDGDSLSLNLAKALREIEGERTKQNFCVPDPSKVCGAYA